MSERDTPGYLAPNFTEVKTLEEALSLFKKDKNIVCCLDLSNDKSAPLTPPKMFNVPDAQRLILVSDSYDSHSREWLTKLCPGAFLLKPVSLEQMSAAVDLIEATRKRGQRQTSLIKRKVNSALDSAETLVSLAPHGFIIADPDGRTVYANQTLAEMLGMTQDEIIGAMPWKLLAPESVPRFEEIYEKRRSGREYQTYEISLQGNKTEPFQVVVTALGIYDESRRFLGSFGRVSPKNIPSSPRPRNLSRSQRSLCILLNSMLPSLLTMKSPERLRSILDFIETFLTSKANDDVLMSVNIRAESALTSTEVALCAMIRSGLTSAHIAEIFGVSEKTISYHRGRLRKKLRLQGRSQSLCAFLSRSIPLGESTELFPK